ncbi:MAG TPA: hypothetical protein DCL48_08210, partial [Alphaproteobacteria bacterium]|nr:hypothetical protein [Alphaproteobacteria bacterium]
YHEGRYPIRLQSYDRGTVNERVLGVCDPHGHWLEWHA